MLWPSTIAKATAPPSRFSFHLAVPKISHPDSLGRLGSTFEYRSDTEVLDASYWREVAVREPRISDNN